MENITSFINLNLLIFVLWLPQALYQIAVWTYWLQIKEYRMDRFWIFIKSEDGRESLLFKSIIAKVIAFLSAGISLYIPLALLLFLNINFVKDVLGNNIRIPVRTKRIEKILTTSFLGVLITFPLFYYLQYKAFVVGETLLIVGLLAGILWTVTLVNNAKKKELEKTKSILSRYKPTVIGITGSYGKTTTKDFIYQLLSTEYKCLSTYKNQNTHFGIFRRINNGLKKEHKYFIAEIGAYKKGEIKEIAEILKPEIAVITGIEPQHLELFGSFENLQDAKFELVSSLLPNGSVLFNLTDEYTASLYERAKGFGKKINVYSYGVTEKEKFDVSSKILKITPYGIDFIVRTGKVLKKIETNLISKDLIENLTAAILIARRCGVPWSKIINECKNLKLPESTLNICITKEGITVIDDSYNSSPSGFVAALNLLDNIKGRNKYVATTGIIELGIESFPVHRKIGVIMDKVADRVLLRNKDFAKSIKSGLKNRNKLLVISKPKKMLNYLKSNLKEKDVLLIEGKLPLISNYYTCSDDSGSVE